MSLLASTIEKDFLALDLFRLGIVNQEYFGLLAKRVSQGFLIGITLLVKS